MQVLEVRFCMVKGDLLEFAISDDFLAKPKLTKETKPQEKQPSLNSEDFPC
jgi:hypothetical protein